MDALGVKDTRPIDAPIRLEIPSFLDERERDQRQEQRAPVLLAGVAALTLFFVPQTIQLFPVLGQFQLAKLIAVAVGVYLISSRRLLGARVRLASAPQVGLLIGILALAVITVPTSVWPSQSIGYIVDAFAKNVVFVYLLLQAVRSERDARAIAAVLVTGSCFLAFAILAHMGPVVTYKNEPGRLAVGASYDPNDIALLMVIPIPFAFFLLSPFRAWIRVLLVASIAVMLAGVVVTQSRGGFLGLVIAGAVMLLRGSRQARKVTFAMIAISILLFTLAAPQSFWSRISTIYNYEGDYNLREDGGRVAVWRNGLQMIAANPITGVGIACFPVEQAALSPSRLQMAAHNSFLQISAELGVAGLILFSSIIIISIRRARLIRRQAARDLADPSLVWFASSVEVSFIGFAVSGFFLSHAYSPIFCFLTGMAGALVARHKQLLPISNCPQTEIEYV